MATQLQIRRGTAAQVAAFTGAEGEIVYNSTNDSLHTNDGATAGGFELARADLNNVLDADLNAALTGNTLSALTITTLTAGAATFSGEIAANGGIALGDNDKAIFGAGGDLEIFHDGTRSLIRDSGTGSLLIRATDLSLQNADGASYASFVSGGAGTFNHNNVPKLATTATGIDVTGTVTADGLNVQNGSNAGITFDLTANYSPVIKGSQAVSDLYLAGVGGGGVNIFTTDKSRLLVQNNGDISFYEDTGTTPKFFWDASAESLGIGTSFPATTLHITKDGNQSAVLDAYEAQQVSHNTIAYTRWVQNASGIANIMGVDSAAGILGTSSNHALAIRTNNTTRMRIDASGNILFGSVGQGYISGDVANTYNSGYNQDDDNWSTWMNYYGYLGGATRYRDFIVGNGKQGRIATFDGSSGNVGIGTSSPTSRLQLDGAENRTGGLTLSAGGQNHTYFLSSDVVNVHNIETSSGAAAHTWQTNGTERMRLDASGSLLVGTTDASIWDNTTGNGINLRGDLGLIASARTNAEPLMINRMGTDGEIIKLNKDGTTEGSIGVASNVLTIFATSSSNCGIGFYSNSTVRPLNNSGAQSDNAIDLGDSGTRWDDIYATNGTIQTSDRNEKQDIEALSDAETAVAVACKGLLRKFRWIDSVEEKGDDARIHFGIIAQDLQAAFAAEGLDAGRYAMFISSTWWETQTEVDAVEAVEFVQAVEAVYDEDGELVSEAVEGVEAVEAKDAYTRTDTFQTLADAPEGATERTRLGVRYPELLAFIIAAI